MLFPDNANSKHQWREPWFFRLRSRTTTAWLLRGGFFTGVYVLFAILFSMAHGPQFGATEFVVLPAIFTVLFLAMTEIPNLQRIVTLTDNDISCIGAMRIFSSPLSLLMCAVQWNRREIKSVHLMRSEETGNNFPFAIMVVTPKYSRAKQLAVPPTVMLNEIADHLHSMGVSVQLSGWQPTAEDSTENATQSAT